MKRTVWRLAGAWLASAALTITSAQAAEKPQVGPPPAWVHAAPSAPVPTAAVEALPFAILVHDIQLNFDADSWTEFHAITTKVQSPEGLQTLGAIPYQWSPWSDTLTFHYARILRGGQTIDVLPKDGAFTVLRRETGLERAMLTGELTAVLQPEGLQVGDVLELAASIRHADPLLKGRTSALIEGWDLNPVARMRLEARWPSSLPVRWRETAGLTPLRRVEAGGVTMVTLDLTDLHAPVLPAHAPARFQHGRQVEFTTFADWKDVAAVMKPLFVKAATLEPHSALAVEAQRIAAATSDPKARAGAALKLVEGQVRYLAHVDAAGGYTPQSADETWRLRYGDCKAKTVLLLALLRALEIPAEPALASVARGDGLDGQLPSAALFDHVLVRTRLGGRDYWLDGTREGDRGLDDLERPAFGWVLPMAADDAKLVRIGPAPATRPQLSQTIRYDASAGVTAPEPTRFETVFRGDAGTILHTKLAAVPKDRLDAALRAFWTSAHSAFTPAHVAAAFDPATGEERLTADGASKLDWSGSGLELEHVALGGKLDVVRDPAASDPDAPFLVEYPAYVEVDESVVLPPGDTPSRAAVKAAEVDQTIAGVAYRRTATLDHGVFRVVASQRGLTPEIPAAEARAAVDRLTKLGNQTVYAPAGSQAAKVADDAAALDSQPTSAAGHVSRGSALIDAGRYPEAITELDAAVALDASDRIAWSDRAIAKYWSSDFTGARTDLAKAETLGPPEVTSLHARALLAEHGRDWASARAAYRRALSLQHDDSFALSRLPEVDVEAKDYAAALRDVDDMVRTTPALAGSGHLTRAAIMGVQHRQAEALRELAAAPADTADARLSRAEAYLFVGRADLARADLDAAIRLKPSTRAWLLRAQLDGGFDSAAAAADVEAAAKLDPDDENVAVWMVNAAVHRREDAVALAMMDKLVAAHPDESNLRVGRARIEARLGRIAGEGADFTHIRSAAGLTADDLAQLCSAELQVRNRSDAALEDCGRALQADPGSSELLLHEAIAQHRAGHEAEIGGTVAAALAAAQADAMKLNNFCYELATENIALDRSLAACDASLKLQPDSAATLDSRAFVLMRMGRYAEALPVYDAALAKNPKEMNSLYGRGLVERRLGRATAGDKDVATALATRPSLRQDFANMGVR